MPVRRSVGLPCATEHSSVASSILALPAIQPFISSFCSVRMSHAPPIWWHFGAPCRRQRRGFFFSVTMVSCALPNRIDVVDGGKDQHGRAARGGGGGDGALPVGQAGGEGSTCSTRGSRFGADSHPRKLLDHVASVGTSYTRSLCASGPLLPHGGRKRLRRFDDPTSRATGRIFCSLRQPPIRESIVADITDG